VSSYSCIVPVDWDFLWKSLIPSWLSLLDGTLDPATFYERYVPEGVEFGDEFLTEIFSAPADYLSQFPKDGLSPPYPRDVMYSAGKSQGFLDKVDLHADPYLLLFAIKQTASRSLPGADLFADDYWGAVHTGTGERRTDAMSSKNFFHFLNDVFDVVWQPEAWRYAYFRKTEKCSPRLHELLEMLFLYTRVVPGTWFPGYAPMWPSHDDLSYAGYLLPVEVSALSEELARWAWPVPGSAEDAMFPLFADRVTRAAEGGFGLITLHAG